MAQPRMYGNIEIFNGTGSEELARKIAEYLAVPLSPREIVTFPNENIFVRLQTSVRGQDVFIIQTTSSPVNYNIMELLLLLDTVKRASAGRITAVIPYFAYARSDKKDQPRVPISARLLADLVTVAGADRYILVDLHAGQIQGFFGIPGDELTAFHILSDYFVSKKLNNAVVVAVDLGFAKKGRNFAEKLHLPMAFIEKRRDRHRGHRSRADRHRRRGRQKHCARRRRSGHGRLGRQRSATSSKSTGPPTSTSASRTRCSRPARLTCCARCPSAKSSARIPCRFHLLRASACPTSPCFPSARCWAR